MILYSVRLNCVALNRIPKIQIAYVLLNPVDNKHSDFI